MNIKVSKYIITKSAKFNCRPIELKYSSEQELPIVYFYSFISISKFLKVEYKFISIKKKFIQYSNIPKN